MSGARVSDGGGNDFTVINDGYGNVTTSLLQAFKEEYDVDELNVVPLQLCHHPLAVVDYTDEVDIYEPTARLIFLLLNLLVDSPINNPLENKVLLPDKISVAQATLLAKVGVFTSSLVDKRKEQNPLPVARVNILMSLIAGILVNDSIQSLSITSLGADMLKVLCQGDDEYQPSILCDAILIGTMILTSAMVDAMQSSVDDHKRMRLYPVLLRDLCHACEMNVRYSFPKSYLGETVHLTQVIQYLILKIAQLVLIDKTLPFDPDRSLAYFQRVNEVLPPAYFDKYQLNEVHDDTHDAWVNVSGADRSEALLLGKRYNVADLRRWAEEGRNESDIFQPPVIAKISLPRVY